MLELLQSFFVALVRSFFEVMGRPLIAETAPRCGSPSEDPLRDEGRISVALN
jgi:hypothetical protein